MRIEGALMRIVQCVALVFCLTLSLAAQDTQVPPPPSVKAPPASALKTASGLRHKLLKAGKGKVHPKISDMVTVEYTGWTTDGKTFDTTMGRHPETFGVDEVIKGWKEGLQLMVEGEKRRFWIPEPLAYRGRKAPYGMLVFDVELLKISPGSPTAN
jgi:FKBP-type peptidyl-prolyl cis-trans isomerase